MAAGELLVDERTQEKLGEEGLQEVGSHLWPIDCQTCGRALGKDAPALCIDDMMVAVHASLHHEQCRAPGWNDSGEIRTPSQSLLSWRGRPVLLPLSDSEGNLDMRPMLLVNPGLELVGIDQDEQQQWHVCPSRAFTQAGLMPPGQVPIGKPIPDAIARVAHDSLEVTWQDAGQTYHGGVRPEQRQILDRARELGGTLLGITHALVPSEIDEQKLYQLFQSGRLLAGWVPLHGTAAAKAPATKQTGQAAATYVLHWTGRHMSVGRLLAETSGKLADRKARSWANRIIGAKKSELLPWKPVTGDHPEDGWYTMNAISVRQYLLRRHSDGWQLVEALSRSDGTTAETDNEAKAWAVGVLQHQEGISGVTWEPGPTTPGAITLYARS